MAIKSYFYDSIAADRLYSAQDFANAFKVITTNGVIESAGNMGFDISGADFRTITPGLAVIEGHFIVMDANEILTVPSGNYPGLIVLRMDSITARAATLKIRTDLTPQQDASIYELPLYEISVVNGIITSVDADLRIPGGAVGIGGGGSGVAAHTHPIADIINLQTILDDINVGKANTQHTHEIVDVNGLQTALNEKAPMTHAHAIADVNGLQVALDLKAPAAHGHSIADIMDLQIELDNLETTKSEIGHIHAIGDITNLQTTLDSKAAANHTHDYASITNKPLTFNPSLHSHGINDISGLQTALDGKALKASTGTTDPSGAPLYIGQFYVNTTTKEVFVAGSMAGDWQSISQDELGGGTALVDWADVQNKPLTYPPSLHSHGINDISGLQAALDAKFDDAGGTISGITSFTGGDGAITLPVGNTIISYGTSLMKIRNAGYKQWRINRYQNLLSLVPSTLADGNVDDFNNDIIFTDAGEVQANSFNEGGTTLGNKYAAKTHAHTFADVTGLQAELDSKADIINNSTETGFCGVGTTTANTVTSSVAGVGVNFRAKKSFVPSSISLTTTSAITGVVGQVAEISVNGFWLYINGKGATGQYLYWRGTYNG